jgi:hypothetical protein
MSQENVEVVRGIVEAFMRRDCATALTGYDEAVELDQTRMPDGGVYHSTVGGVASRSISQLGFCLRSEAASCFASRPSLTSPPMP